jgi:hypothetical protein
MFKSLVTISCFIVLFSATVVVTHAGWQLVTPYGTTNDLRAVAVANGRFVAGGAVVLLYSDDNGAAWKAAQFTGAPDVRGIVYGNDMFVAAGSGPAYRSTDGKTWIASATSVEANSLAFGNGTFVATGNGSISHSTDGANWTVISNVTAYPIRYAAYGKGKFVAFSAEHSQQLSSNIVIVTSADGKDWTTTTFTVAPPPTDYYCPPRAPCDAQYAALGLASDGAGFLASVIYQKDQIGILGRIYLRSNDGVTWGATHGSDETAFFPSGEDLLKSVNGQVIVLGDTATTSDPRYLATLPDLTRHTLPFPRGQATAFPRDIAGNESALVVVGTGGYIAHGPNVNAMELSAAGSAIGLSSVAAVGARIVGVGPALSTELSTNSGATWTTVALPNGAAQIKSVKYADGKFVVVGASGTVFRSTFGDTWSKRLSNTSSDLRDVVFENGLWVAVGKAGTIITSPDAAFFSLQNVATEVQLNGVAAGAGQFIAVGLDGAILSSSNGTSWTVRGTEEAVTLNSIAYGNGRFVAVGLAGYTIASSDLAQWTPTVIFGVGDLTRVAFGDGKFVAVEAGSGRVFESIDGTNWTTTILPELSASGADGSDGHVWISGYGGVIWKSVVDEIKLTGGLDDQQRFRIRITVPVPGKYRVYSTLDLSSAQWTARDALDIATESAWIDDAALSEKSFYVVRQE